MVERGDPSGLTEAALRAALPALTGEIDQVPPMYSAVRIDGRRLHEAARAGEMVERAPRRVTVHALDLGEVGPVGADGLRLRPAGGALRQGDLRPDPGGRPGAVARRPGPPLRAAPHRGRPLPARGRPAARGAGAAGAGPTGRPCWPASSRRPTRSPSSRWLPVDANGAIALSRGRQLLRPGEADGLCRVVGPDGALVAIGEVLAGRLRPVRVITAPVLPGVPGTPASRLTAGGLRAGLAGCGVPVDRAWGGRSRGPGRATRDEPVLAPWRSKPPQRDRAGGSGAKSGRGGWR